MASFLFVALYASMAAAALLVELLFSALGLIPQQRNALVVEATTAWNYTTWLNIAFLAFAAYLIWRFVRTGGVPDAEDDESSAGDGVIGIARVLLIAHRGTAETFRTLQLFNSYRVRKLDSSALRIDSIPTRAVYFAVWNLGSVTH